MSFIEGIASLRLFDNILEISNCLAVAIGLDDDAAGGGSGGADAADALHCGLRADVVFADDKDDALHEFEGMFEHELFHLTVVVSAPMTAGQECPADLDG